MATLVAISSASSVPSTPPASRPLTTALARRLPLRSPHLRSPLPEAPSWLWSVVRGALRPARASAAVGTDWGPSTRPRCSFRARVPGPHLRRRALRTGTLQVLCSPHRPEGSGDTASDLTLGRVLRRVALCLLEEQRGVGSRRGATCPSGDTVLLTPGPGPSCVPGSGDWGVSRVAGRGAVPCPARPSRAALPRAAVHSPEGTEPTPRGFVKTWKPTK